MAFRYVAIALLLWSLYASSFAPASGGRGDTGCMIDPNGCSATTLGGDDGDDGNGFDPHG